MFNQENYDKYLKILEEELVLALGCTEPISVAYGAALATKYLNNFPTKVIVKSSGNIFKNAKSVVVPNTNGLKGMQASILAGIVGGNADLELEVLSNVSEEQKQKIGELMNSGLVEIENLETPITLHTITYVTDGTNEVEVEIQYQHTNVVRITVNGEDVISKDLNASEYADNITDRSILSIDQILDFVEVAKEEDYYPLLSQQIENNLKIAEDGLNNDYGVNVGRSLLKHGDGSIETKVKAMSAAGSDARMSGCTLPVMTNSGSGNQGMTCSTPVIVYATEKGYDKKTMYKALLLANLVTIHVKTGLTRLSSYCGAVVAASGSAAGFAYLEGLDREQIKMSITNVLGAISGIICDGAKESCPSKIASGIDSALQALYLARDNQVFGHGCGIVEADIENTIKNVGKLGLEGMKGTDKTILDIMVNISN